MTSSPRRVLHVIEDLGLGGAERLLVTLLPELQVRGFEVEVAALGARRDLVPALESAGVAVHQAGLASLRRPVAALRWLSQLIRRGGYDLIHTHLAFANLYGRLAGRSAGLAVTTTYHDIDYESEVLLENPTMTSGKQMAYRIADRTTAMGGVRQVVAVSEYVARSVRRRLGYSKDEVVVIYNGVPSSASMTVDEETKRVRRRQLGLAPEATIVVQVGRLSPQKGQRHTVEAARRLCAHRGLHWILVGDGPLRSELESSIARNDLGSVISVVGGQVDVQPFLAAADLFVFPSLHEGLGIAVLEAMAAGLPVVAYGSGPLPEVVSDGETGVLVPSGNVDALAAAVDALASAPSQRREFGAAGLARVTQRFSIAATAEGHAHLYRRLVAPRAPRGS